MPRSDFSEYVVHFTTNRPPFGSKKHDLSEIKDQDAKRRLFSILEQKQIIATPMPWTDALAVCFTESTWSGLLDHAQKYSRFGIGFKKSVLFESGGAPAIYMPPHLFNAQRDHIRNKIESEKEFFAPEIFPFITTFAPNYMNSKYIQENWTDGGKPRKITDYSHEREWRTPSNFDFLLDQVEFVIVGNYEDMAHAPKNLKDTIGREKWIIMENYRKIEEIWPTHIQ
jgi:hypothetical protein